MLDFISLRKNIFFSFQIYNYSMIRQEIHEKLNGVSWKFVNLKRNQITTGNATITQENE